jgi:putative lipoprotein (rSAM/lipoprotein system)
MKKKDISWVNRLCKWMLAAMLPTVFACSLKESIESVSDVPTANYIIRGTVVSEEDIAIKIPDLQVVVSHAAPHPSADTLFTGSDGTFAWEGPVSTFGKDIAFTITVMDIDDKKNKQYAPYTTHISFSKNELDNDISWFLGEASKEVFIKMKELADSSLYQ